MNKWNGAKDRPEFVIEPVGVAETVEAIKNMKSSPSQGHDRLDAIVLKIAAVTLCRPLNHITNLSILKQTFCPKWKLGKLIPLYKGSPLDKLKPESYRPISLLPVVAKLVERQVHTQMMKFMESTNQLNKNCHAYRKLLGTASAMIEVNDDIYEAADARKIAELMTIDQSSAFDCVRYEILEEKLKLYNFSENARKWVMSYLTFRSQYVTIGTRDSVIKPMVQGVPQGSVLGPLLFVIYLNELPTVIKDDIGCNNQSHSRGKDDLFGQDCPNCGRMICYSDDSTYVTASTTREENQTKVIRNHDNITEFLTANGMMMNPTKTTLSEHMVRQRRNVTDGSPPTLVTKLPNGDDKIIQSSRFTRLLGGNIQDDLTWRGQLELGKKALLPILRTKIGALKIIARNVPEKGRLCLANGIIISKLLYLLPTWGGTHESNLKKTQQVMNMAARVVLNVGRKTKVRTLMENCRWMYIRELDKLHTTLTLWKILRLRKPESISRKFQINTEDLVTTSRPRLQIVENSFRWRSVKYWNSLPREIRQDKSLPSFKKKIEKMDSVM